MFQIFSINSQPEGDMSLRKPMSRTGADSISNRHPFRVHFHNCLIHLLGLMKHYVRLCLFMVVLQMACIVNLRAQNGWAMAVLNKNEEPAILIFKGRAETAENGKEYLRIFDDSYQFRKDLRERVKLPYGYRMADKKIYIYNFDSKQETVAMDFTLSVGDHFTTYNGMQWEVEAVKDTLVNVSFCGWCDSVSKRLLRVRTLDGTMTDQWLEDFGSFANHFMIRSMENVLFSHTLWMEYGYGEYLARDISADPFYSHDSGWLDSRSDEGEEAATVRCFLENGNVVFENVYWAWEHRDYSCFYRKGDDIYDLYGWELEPHVDDGELAMRKDSFTFKGIPAPASGAYTLHVGDDSYSTGIRPVMRSPQSSHRIYDAQGRQLPAKPKRGLYIQDGVKYNAR